MRIAAANSILQSYLLIACAKLTFLPCRAILVEPKFRSIVDIYYAHVPEA